MHIFTVSKYNKIARWKVGILFKIKPNITSSIANTPKVSELSAHLNFRSLLDIMPTSFNFRQYHYRSINAANDAERTAINQELKDLYESLSETDKADFNAELQVFLATEYGRLRTDYEAIKSQQDLN